MHLTDVDLLRRLVGFETVSRLSNLPMVDFICDYVDEPGTRIWRNLSPDGTKANLIIAVGAEARPDRDGLLLCGHTDVVPADEDGWHSDPFALSEADQSYVGRGTCDMKGFLALAVNRLRAVDPRRLRSPLVLLFTYDEEVGTRGAKHFTETWPATRSLPRATIVGEPTSLRAIRMHKGHIELCLTIVGRSAHSGYPHLGTNAIEPLGDAIVALRNLREDLEAARGPESEFFPDVPFVSLNVARVTGGTAVNVVPDQSTLDLGVRLLPGMDSTVAISSVRSVLSRVLHNRPFRLDVVTESPPMVTRPEASIYRAVCAEIHQRETLSAAYATDAGWLQSLGLECVIFGPGSIEVAHRPNECLPAAEFRRGAGLLDRLINRLCVDTS